MTPFDVLCTYLAGRAAFSDADFEAIRREFVHRALPGGAFLQRAGDVAQHAAFVAHGCLRKYVIDDKGKEHIVEFAPETWWLGDSRSERDRTPSPYFIDAIEDCELLLLDGPSHQRLVDGVPGCEASFRLVRSQ